jgi:pyridoxine 4-dehydrogenase
MTTTKPALASGTLELGGDLTVHRLGFGAMRITGDGVWGPPRDHDEALRVLRRAVELGVDFIDTADSYGPYVSEELIREALHPYPEGLVVATKAGFVRTGPNEWHPLGRPEYLRQECEMSLRRLGLERIDLLQLHRPDPAVRLEDSVGALVDLQRQGKVRHIGLSNVNRDELQRARGVGAVVSVQNMFSSANQRSAAVLDVCERDGLAFIPWRPVADVDDTTRAVASELGATPSQVALAWLLARSPVMLPIPGTSSVAHLEENVAAASIELTPEHMARLTH